ncbi:pentatricopeptide repeat-containing protein At2g27610 [Phalaenopsis equestris]|uniref:pentatricopeptide repeat-containing protein At2g27610 n=1 Tax=Phalaenopsis equestris TaxID=78828 RepID=UPI0009E515BE|nr:pentatricopeptide repeat-containing protein At2g27610 [Phalaenopsis equestris]
MLQRGVFSWTSLFAEYMRNGLQAQILDIFFQMQSEGVRPNTFTFASALASAATGGELQKGTIVHGQLIKSGHEATVFVCNSLMNMYSKCRLIKNSKSVFEALEHRNSISWNSMMAGLVSNGSYTEALEFYFQMRVEGIKPTQSSFVTAINICANLKNLVFARQLHGCVVKEGYGLDGNSLTALLVAYIKCAEMEDALKLFYLTPETRNVVSFTALIGGCAQNGSNDRAAVIFSEMRKDGVEPNDFTYSTVLTAAPMVSPFLIHCLLIKTRYECFPSVGTALLDAYTKFGNLDDALMVFEKIEDKDVVAWSAMVASYSQAGDTEASIRLFMEMAREGVVPNQFTISSIINVCASATAGVDQGRQFHAESIKLRLQDDICVSSALLTMYAKKGSIENAYKVFERQSARDLVSWNSMISGFARHGYGKKALDIFADMEAQGLEMDDITLIGVIMACTHTGFVEEGKRYLNLMVKEHGIRPTMEVYACMVDLYGRAGELEEAMKLIKGMPFEADAMVWRVLLGVCRVHRNMELGEIAAENLIKLEPQDSAAYVLLSNIYAAEGEWEKRGRIRRMMEERRVRKEAGLSWIQVRNKVHAFMASDTSHALSDQIYRKLEEMKLRLREKGYVPDTNFVLHDLEDEHKEALLAQHSERLAMAFGLISTPEGSPLQIVKNLRVCGDCHTVMKLMSDIEGREIVVRDSNRFHHFKGGSCSCGDFW